MASWWTAADPEDNSSIVSRVIQAVGLFGDILSLEDTMLSEAQRDEEESVQEAGGEEVMMEEDEEEKLGEEGGEQQIQDWKDENWVLNAIDCHLVSGSISEAAFRIPAEFV